MTSGFKISEADPDTHYDTLVALQEACFPGSTLWPPEGAHWWIARDRDGGAIGFGGLYIENHDYGQAMLCRSGVLQCAHGYGLQRALIRVRERKAKLLGLTRITTYTAADNSHSMNNLIACGYRTYEPPRGWASEGCVYWQKILSV